jgi:hypothetical protein
VGPIQCTSPHRDHIGRLGTRGAILIEGYGFRTSSGSLAMFAAIGRAPGVLETKYRVLAFFSGGE